jgi:exodeoxyribonuclease III
VRIVHWNVLHGGGKRVAAIAAEIASRAPDVVALSEFRAVNGEALRDAMLAAGLWHVVTTEPGPRRNGLALYTRERPLLQPPPADPGLADQRWLEVTLPGALLGIAFVYVPPVISVGEETKARFWEMLLAEAERRRDDPFLILGDLNTGAPWVDEPRASLHASDAFVRLGRSGWTDVWRHFHGPEATEWTWLSKGRGRRIGWGYRLDHAFASPSLVPRLRAARYVHEPRDAGLSDHSLMIVDVE